MRGHGQNPVVALWLRGEKEEVDEGGKTIWGQTEASKGGK